MSSSYSAAKYRPPENDDTVTDLPKSPMNMNEISEVSKPNETGMSDNQAFMAYMSKAGDDDEDDD